MLEIIPASTWGRNVRGNPAKLRPDRIDELTIHYTGAPRVSIGKADVPAYIKRTERSHQARPDSPSTLGYNFIIDKWGRVWEGRGFGLRNAANGTASNDTSVSVLLLVGVNDNQPTAEMISTLQLFYQHLCQKFGRQLSVRPHGYHKPTSCPGSNVIALINSGVIQQTPAPVPQPEPVPQPPAPPAPAPERTVTVAAGDSWWKLASRHLGSGLKWKKLKDHNPGVSLHPGVVIRIPEV